MCRPRAGRPHDRLHATENALKAFKQKTHLVELVKDRDDQIALVTTLAASRQKSVSDLAGLRAQVASDQDEMSREPAETASETQAPNPVVAGANESIRTLEVQRVGLIQPGGLTPKAPQVRALDAQIAALQARLMIQPLLATTWTSAPNLFRIALQEKIADLQAQVPVTQTEIAITGADLARAKLQVDSYAGLELSLDRFTAEHDAAQIADKNFSDQLADLNLRGESAPCHGPHH